VLNSRASLDHDRRRNASRRRGSSGSSHAVKGRNWKNKKNWKTPIEISARRTT
jgi:hypothetical protein